VIAVITDTEESHVELLW